MTRVAYTALGSTDSAIKQFEALTPWVREMMSLKAGCPFGSAGYMAMSIPLDGLRTAAHHFTRRRDFYGQLECEFVDLRGVDKRLADPAEAKAAFEALRPYFDRLCRWKDHCKPFGRDYCAVDVALQSLKTAVLHFTHDACFYGAAGDGATPGRGRR